MKKILFAVLFLQLFTFSCYSQNSESIPISTQRPSFNESAPELSLKTIQIEYGFSSFKEYENYSIAIRYSPIEKFETRIVSNYINEEINLGLKYSFYFDYPVIFSINADLPIKGNNPQARLAAYYPFNDYSYISANYGRMLYRGFSIIQFGYAWTDKIWNHVELSHNFNVRDAIQLNVGLGYLILPNWQFDTSIGIDTCDNIYFEFGGAFKIHHN